MNRISVSECENLLNSGSVLIDIREPWETAICTIGGELIPMSTIVNDLENLDKEKSYILLCKTGKRAEAVANLMITDYQFKQISILEGGITEWFASKDANFEMY
jgi:adenylyltransferase/sulfurtransferase